MSESTVELVDRLVERFPALQPLLREHLADNFGEVLPHLFIGDLTRHVIGECERGSGDAVRDIVTELESVISSGDEEIDELIAVSFLANLPQPGEPGGMIRTLLGPKLKSELDRMAGGSTPTGTTRTGRWI